MKRTRRSHYLRAAVAAPLVVAALAGCGGDAGETGDGSGGTVAEDAAAGDGAPGVPEACRDAFPQALGPADLSELALLPEGFPSPPVDATLCITAETIGGAQETASYASEATEDEILAGYESALAAYGAAREQDGIGRPIVTATSGDVVIQVTPQDGGFALAFAR
jgi:hypothetical protein